MNLLSISISGLKMIVKIFFKNLSKPNKNKKKPPPDIKSPRPREKSKNEEKQKSVTDPPLPTSK